MVLVVSTPFHLAHQGLNDMDIQSAMSEAFTQLCPELIYVAPRLMLHTATALSHDPKSHGQYSLHRGEVPSSNSDNMIFRIGFISCNFFDHSIGRILIELIATMQTIPDLEITVFLTNQNVLSSDANSVDDQITQFFESTLGSRFVRLPGTIQAIRDIVGGRQYSLDTLIFADVGMEFASYALSHSRLAPIQVSLQLESV